MMQNALTTRLVLLSALLSLIVLSCVGTLLYQGLDMQLSLRDDAALVTRVDQIRTVLQDANTMDLIRQKPRLFANMMGNHEALLVLKFVGEAPMVEINPGNVPIPLLRPLPADAPLELPAVHHMFDASGTPFSALAAMVRTADPKGDLQILAGRVMTERSQLLAAYRIRIILMVGAGVLLSAIVALFFTRVGLRPLRQLARQIGAIGINSLDTRLQRASAPVELVPLIDGFNVMLDRLTTGFAQMAQLSADMAHEMRTPISNLLGQTEVALSQRRNNDYYEALLVSNFEEFQRLSRMMDGMLFLARSDHPDALIEPITLDLADEFQRIADYFEGLLDERNIRLELKGNGSVMADPILLRRALANLVANAIQYADPDSVIILSSTQHSNEVTLSVQNHGPVIPQQQCERLFDRFYRADESRRGSAHASGLGLSIVRSIMALHHGRSSVSSANGITRFNLIFKKPNVV